MFNRTRSVLALTLAGVVLAACGGAASPSPAATAPAVPAATEAPSGTAASAPSIAPGASSGAPGIDLGAAAQALESIDSYRLTMTLEGATATTIQATVVRQPEPAQQLSITSGGSTQNIILIDQQAWLDPGTGTYAPVPAELASGMSQAFDPVLLLGTFSNPLLRVGLEEIGREDRNGVSATHYRLDPDGPAGQAAGLPEGATMDLWLADEGHMVAFEATNIDPATPGIRFDITNVNDPANRVEAPG
jgi:hypothetical protein